LALISITSLRKGSGVVLCPSSTRSRRELWNYLSYRRRRLMKPLTLEDIASEHAAYTEHLVKGGKPFQIIFTLVPGDEALDWRCSSPVPDGLPRKLVWTTMFVAFIKASLMEAIQPPGASKFGKS
jgi:hypothetical protein